MQSPKRIVFTGGPSGGKTSIIEIVQRHYGSKVVTVPESATILYSGGFPRKTTEDSMRYIQRAIYYVIKELEDLTFSLEPEKIALCDRGTLDGIAYWPEQGEDFLTSLKTSMDEELARYALVIHLRPPVSSHIYRTSGTRIEDHAKALEIDKKIEKVWSKHKKRYIISDEPDFLVKVDRVIEILEKEIKTIEVRGEMTEVRGDKY